MSKHMIYLAAVAWANGGTLRDADLIGADLHGADLPGANLYGAYLRGADLCGAKYQDDTLNALIAAAERMDGYDFRLFRLQDGVHKIMAGCRWLTIPEYRAHVAKKYPDTVKARETLDILDYFEKRIAAKNV